MKRFDKIRREKKKKILSASLGLKTLRRPWATNIYEYSHSYLQIHNTKQKRTDRGIQLFCL